MKKPRRQQVYVTQEEQDILGDHTIPISVAMIMLDMAHREVLTKRQYILYGEQRRKASLKYREKIKNLQNRKRTYNFWKPEEIEYILTSTDSDLTQAKKLDRSVESIQKKRERERRKRDGH